MRPALRKSILALAIVTAGFAAGERSAAAQGTGGTTGTVAALAASDFPIFFQRWDADRKTWIDLNDTERMFYFNRGHCECNADTTASPGRGAGYVRISIRPPSTTSRKISAALTANSFSLGIGKILAGGNTYNCLQPSTAYSLNNYCTNLVDPTTYDYDASFPLTVFNTQSRYDSQPIPVSAFFGAASSATQPTCGAQGTCNDVSICSKSQIATVVYLWVQTKAGTESDIKEAPAKGALNIVGTPANQPTSMEVTGGNEALEVSWEWRADYSPATDPNIFGIQLFCQRGADNEVFPGHFSPAFRTAKTLCPDSAPTTSSYGAFSNLDPKYLCSGLLSPSRSSYRIKGLQNGIYYGVGLAVVDKYFNVSAIDPAMIKYRMPDPTVDFYTEYRDLGGSAEGGFCNIARGTSRPGIAALLLVAGVAALVRRRRRTRRRTSGSAGLLLFFVAAGLSSSNEANAQTVYHDGSLAENHSYEPWRGSPRRFALEARFGFYSPNVDSEIRGDVKPHDLLFGSKRRPMWQIELDWQFLQRYGTLAVAGVVGYFKETAGACTPKELHQECVRSEADNTSLRLIPLAALLVYRMDLAAEHWKIPLVPYAKIGLNYTIWTVTNGNGDVPNYGTNGRGQGGTMGWQAAIGISLRLDFIDPAAARGFDADSGVNHSYAFFELDHINGSGLYRNDVLRVGDSTWFAGLMFEF